jgi:hypothetical protein
MFGDVHGLNLYKDLEILLKSTTPFMGGVFPWELDRQLHKLPNLPTDL